MTIREHTRAYSAKSDRLGALSLLGTVIIYLAALILAAGQSDRPLICAALVVVLAFASVRLYVLQHDCGHHALFTSKRINDAAGHLLSVPSMTPYRVMQYNHNLHHAYLGNLDHRETTEVYTMTLSEWEQARWWTRLWYRLYRNPAIMLSLGGIYAYFLAYRWPRNTMKVGPWGVVAHNIALLGFLGAIWWGLGWAGLTIWALNAVLAGMIGVFLVYLQHNFEDTYWDRKPDLDFRRATLEGSSSLDLGWLWDLGTGNIAYHDLHHFNPGIPSYRLRQCQRDLPEDLKCHGVIRWPEAIASFRLKLWDEGQQKLVPFPVPTARAALPAE